MSRCGEIHNNLCDQFTVLHNTDLQVRVGAVSVAVVTVVGAVGGSPFKYLLDDTQCNWDIRASNLCHQLEIWLLALQQRQ